MSQCIRVLVLLFLLIFTACATCSSLFAQFRVKSGHESNYMSSLEVFVTGYSVNNMTIDYWQVTAKVPQDGLAELELVTDMTDAASFLALMPRKAVNPTREAFKQCSELKTYFLASGALAIAGAAFGGLATLLAAAHICSDANCCLACSILLFCLVAFACMAVSFALMVRVYLKETCKFEKFTNHANLVEGFGLSVAACGGFLITAFFELCA